MTNIFMNTCVIGIDASRAFLKRRTGIEEYAYQVIRHLRVELSDQSVILYIRRGQVVDFEIPASWRVRELWAPRFWTQIRLSWEMLWHTPNVLFVPAHTVPMIHPAHIALRSVSGRPPRRTVVVVHGLEYEFCPQAYSFWERWYMRVSIWCSVRWASRVVCVSENTRRDVMALYGVSAEKISVIGEGYNVTRSTEYGVRSMQNSSAQKDSGSECTPYSLLRAPYFLFIGRIEERKNVGRIIEAFEMFKQETGLPHQLVLAGKPGYEYEKIQQSAVSSQQSENIIELGYVSEEEKWELLRGAEAFVFPSLCEGFGIPVLEAQSVGTAVITSTTSSLPEVAGDGALLVNPDCVTEIAEAMKRLVSDKALKDAIIATGKENIKRYSWERCAKEMANVVCQ
jgi:glycosyltransferase involved in cell wall biosynthesis